MKLISIHCILGVFCLLTFKTAKLQTLQIGDKMADLELDHVINYNSHKLNLADFHNKLIILNHWGLTCYPCIKAFDRIDSLQRKFADSVQIIMVNREDLKKTKDFFF